MPGLSVGLLSRMPSIYVSLGRKIIVDEIIIPQLLFSYIVNIPDNGYVSPKFTFLNGAPRAIVDFGDQTPSVIVENGLEIPHLYKTRGLYKISLISQAQEIYLKEIDIRGEPVIVTESWPELLLLSNLTRLHDPWVIGYGEVGIMKIARAGYIIDNPIWVVGLGVVGLFTIEEIV